MIITIGKAEMHPLLWAFKYLLESFLYLLFCYTNRYSLPQITYFILFPDLLTFFFSGYDLFFKVLNI